MTSRLNTFLIVIPAKAGSGDYVLKTDYYHFQKNQAVKSPNTKKLCNGLFRNLNSVPSVVKNSFWIASPSARNALFTIGLYQTLVALRQAFFLTAIGDFVSVIYGRTFHQ